MSGFVIFALVLTFAYVVYFAVQITLDLHGKKELNEDNEAHLEHIDPKVQCSFFADEFMQNLNEKHNKRKIEKKNARDKM